MAVMTPEPKSLPRTAFACHTYNKACELLGRHPRLVEPVAQAFNEPVYMHQFKINAKAAFTGDVWQWHQDVVTWHNDDGMPEPRAMNISVFLDDVMPINGPLMLVPGSHRQFISCVGETPNEHYKQSLKKQEYGVPDPVSLQLLVEQGGIRSMTAKAGSVVFFDCNTMHGSNSNISPWPRANTAAAASTA